MPSEGATGENLLQKIAKELVSRDKGGRGLRAQKLSRTGETVVSSNNQRQFKLKKG